VDDLVEETPRLLWIDEKDVCPRLRTFQEGFHPWGEFPQLMGFLYKDEPFGFEEPNPGFAREQFIPLAPLPPRGKGEADFPFSRDGVGAQAPREVPAALTIIRWGTILSTTTLNKPVRDGDDPDDVLAFDPFTYSLLGEKLSPSSPLLQGLPGVRSSP